MSTNHEVVFEPFTERHFIKTFAKKYKNAWQFTLEAILQEFRFFDELFLKNTAEMIVYTAEKALKDAGDKVKPEDKTDIEAKIDALKAVKDSTDPSAIKSAGDALSDAIQKIGSAMYGAQGGPQADAAAPLRTAPRPPPPAPARGQRSQHAGPGPAGSRAG